MPKGYGRPTDGRNPGYSSKDKGKLADMAIKSRASGTRSDSINGNPYGRASPKVKAEAMKREAARIEAAVSRGKKKK